MMSPEVHAFCLPSCFLSVQVPAGVFSLWWPHSWPRSTSPSALTFSHFPVVAAVVEQEKWKSWDGGDPVVVKPEDPSLLRSHSYQLCDLSKAA